MPPSQRTTPSKVEVLLKRGLSLVLRRAKRKGRRVECKECEEIAECDFGPEVFLDWIRENEECYWNPCLVQSVKSLEYRGFVRPSTLLVGGTDYSLEVIRSAWGRRVLRPPHGYDIVMLGDVEAVRMSVVPQTQFAPLPEALCKTVYDLTSEGLVPSLPLISRRLRSAFPEIVLPGEDILCRTLGTLIKERKLFHTGSGYAVVTPDTFRLLAMSPPLERQMLLTNEEAIVRLHGTAYTVDDGRTTCTQTQQQEILTAWSSAERILEPRTHGKLKRCHSLKLLRGGGKGLSRSNSFKSAAQQQQESGEDVLKKEKSPSLFSRWFRRGGRAAAEKNRSTQFPPRDTSDPDYALYNSRSTQTSEQHRTKIRSSSLNRGRHSQNVPTTPRASHRNRQDRSSSLSRKTSPKRREEDSPPKPRAARLETPFFCRRKDQLMAGEKYDNDGGPSVYGNKVTPYQTTDLLKSQGVYEKSPPFTPPPMKISEPVPSELWKRPTSWISTAPPPPFDDPPLKHASSSRQLLTPPQPPVTPSPPRAQTATKTDSLKTSETVTRDGKEFSLGTTVEISVSNGKPLLTDAKTNDLLKIATTWNQSIKDSRPMPKLTTTTNITTSVSRDKNDATKGSTESPRCLAKSELFPDSPNTTIHLLGNKEDSGFSSSTSTSRPMSVSPC